MKAAPLKRDWCDCWQGQLHRHITRGTHARSGWQYSAPWQQFTDSGSNRRWRGAHGLDLRLDECQERVASVWRARLQRCLQTFHDVIKRC